MTVMSAYRSESLNGGNRKDAKGACATTDTALFNIWFELEEDSKSLLTKNTVHLSRQFKVSVYARDSQLEIKGGVQGCMGWGRGVRKAVR